MKVLILNGPNLNLLGARDKNSYGSLTLDQINKSIELEFPEIKFTFFQSNIEGELVSKIQIAEENYSALVINPAGYSHTSIAIRDALEVCSIPKIEVHLSNIANREDFRSKSITAAKTNGYLSGFKLNSYLAAIYIIRKILEKPIE